MHAVARSGSHRRRGETKVGVIIVIVVCVMAGMLLMFCVGAGIFLPAMGKARATARQIKDATQVRGIHQGLVLSGQSNGDRYPLPSVYDKNNTTLSLAKDTAPETKDTTANVASILIYNGFFSTQLCLSPAESNPNIVEMANYSQSMPPTAAVPQQALWDPAFSADFTGGKKGNFSYAHSYFRGARRALWGNTFQADEAALGNRGPEIAGVTNRNATNKNPNSNTLLIHGGRTTWEGNIAYNDNHVDFQLAYGKDRTMKDKDGKPFGLWDCHFFDDVTNDPTGANNYLTIITQNGKDESDVTTIWD